MTSAVISSGIVVIYSHQCHSEIQNLGLKSAFLFLIETVIAQKKKELGVLRKTDIHYYKHLNKMDSWTTNKIPVFCIYTSQS